MSNHQNYQTLMDNYKTGVQFVKKLGLTSGIMQFSIIVFINGWKHLEIPYYKFAGLILFSWAIYSFIKDFWTFLRIEKSCAQLILDGVESEKRNKNFGNFFHEVLQNFKLVKVLLQRSLVNLVAFGCFGYFLSQYIVDLNPDFVISPRSLSFVTAIFTALASKFYYDSLKSLAETKEQIFAAKS
ncbi:MAG: hypothetical protein KBA81_04135 [Rhabdochlamydiaceae bacterium]|nr:hypothetical protein [Rhabdochlamydiaceae bacterium]